MLRRPNRASWNEGSAGRPSPLAQLLATPQPLHGIHADNSFVGARHALPGQIGFGPTHQHPVSGTAFTGGRVTNPQTGLVRGPAMPTMAQADSHAGHGEGGAAASTLAALGLLAGTPHGGGATPTLPPGPGTTPPPSPTGADPGHAAAVSQLQNLQNDLTTRIGPTTPNPNTPPPPQDAPGALQNVAASLATLLAALGQKPNPSAGAPPSASHSFLF